MKQTELLNPETMKKLVLHDKAKFTIIAFTQLICTINVLSVLFYSKAHIQARKSSRAVPYGRLFILTLLLCFLCAVKTDARPQLNSAMPVLVILQKPIAGVQQMQQSSLWEDFWDMFSLGMQQIRKDTGHLLFLFTLLLPATLVTNRKQWGQFGGVGYSLVWIFKIVTAFTIGHSVTLLIGATGLITFPGRPIEILIALGILIAAIHAYKPVFSGKEMYTAAGFGLIHGMAFAETLVNLNPDAGHMVLSILGFYLGIGIKQMFIILLIIPWLIILSRINFYNGLRIAGAFIAAVASVGWMVEGITGKPNFVGSAVVSASGHAIWLVVALAVAAIMGFFVKAGSSMSSSSCSR
jgi:hypothetical protein